MQVWLRSLAVSHELSSCRTTIRPVPATLTPIEESLKAKKIEYRRVSFSGTGAKDVTEYMEKHSTEDLVRLIGVDWIAYARWDDAGRPLCLHPMLN